MIWGTRPGWQKPLRCMGLQFLQCNCGKHTSRSQTITLCCACNSVAKHQAGQPTCGGQHELLQWLMQQQLSPPRKAPEDSLQYSDSSSCSKAHATCCCFQSFVLVVLVLSVVHAPKVEGLLSRGGKVQTAHVAGPAASWRCRA